MATYKTIGQKGGRNSSAPYPEAHKTVVLTLYLDGMTRKEIAQHLGLSVHTVGRWLRRSIPQWKQKNSLPH